MTQVKLFISSLVLATAFSAQADTLKGLLDLSNLYGKNNAGQYEVTVTVQANRSAQIEVTQSLANPPSSDQPGMDPQVCLTEFTIRAGQVTVTLRDKMWGSVKTLTQNVNLYSSFYDETENCTPAKDILSREHAFMAYFNLGAQELNYPVPYDYEKLFVRVSVFPYSYSVNLIISQNDRNEFVVSELNSQLSSQLKRGNKEALSYYVYAEKGLSTLSLGNGYVELH